jgi:DNA-binding IclR family transcriptional regulator
MPLGVDAEAAPPVSQSGVIASAIAVLKLLANTEAPVGVNAISRQLALAPSSCFKILKQLQAEELVEFNADTKAYTLGSGTLLLAKRALDPRQAFPTIRPRLELVASETGASIGFWRRVPRGRIVLTGFVEGSTSMRIHMSVGQRLPMLMGSIGREFAAKLNLPESTIRERFDKLRWQTPLSCDEYLKQVETARRRGYSVDRGNYANAVTSVAAAIENRHGGEARYGITGMMFSAQHTEVSIARLGEKLKEAAAWASNNLISD